MRCHFYPRSPCGERLTPARILSRLSLISIHALLAESDRLPTALRTPHQRFLSTLSLRRATAVLQQAQQEADISIHALLAESDLLEQSASYNAALISIHALLAESDDYLFCPPPRYDLFLSTLSLRRATVSISIVACVP